MINPARILRNYLDRRQQKKQEEFQQERRQSESDLQLMYEQGGAIYRNHLSRFAFPKQTGPIQRQEFTRKLAEFALHQYNLQGGNDRSYVPPPHAQTF